MFGLQFQTLLFAQSDTISDHSVGSILVDDAETVLHDAGEIFLAPLHFDKDAWLTTAAISGGTVLLFSLDESVRTLAQRNHSSANNTILEVGKQYGREIYGLSLSGALYLGGLAFRNREVRTTGVMLFESIAFAGITTTVIKSIVGRSRPYVEEGSTRFRGFQFDNNYESLPSGHSTVAFSISSVIAGRIKNTYATIGLYSLATLTAFSRVYHDQHWLSDTFLGAAIGTAVGMTVIHLHEKRTGDASLRISPTLHGVRITLQF